MYVALNFNSVNDISFIPIWAGMARHADAKFYGKYLR